MANGLRIDTTPEGKEICTATIRFSEAKQGVISVKVDGLPKEMKSIGYIRWNECADLYGLLNATLAVAKNQ